MNKKTVIVLVAAVVVVIIAVFRIFGMQTEGENEVENVVSLMEKQIKDENKLEISGYTLDDPNVVLNPYEISPLTALVIFETDEEVSPEVTIHGDSDLTTYTHTFAKGTEHYLPIYGLYAGRENRVTIKCGDEEKELTIKLNRKFLLFIPAFNRNPIFSSGIKPINWQIVFCSLGKSMCICRKV